MGGVFLRKHTFMGMILAGGLAGAVNGLFGAGGGMVLVPLLTRLTPLEDRAVFPASVSIILPICVVSLIFTAMTEGLAFSESLPYLFGSAAGGILAGIWGQKIPVVWLHRGLGLLVLWGGFRYLC